MRVGILAIVVASLGCSSQSSTDPASTPDVGADHMSAQAEDGFGCVEADCEGGDTGGSGSRDSTTGEAPDVVDCEGGVCDVGPTGVDAPIRQVRSGRHHTCALLDGGSVYCWGQGAYRALGGDYDFQGVPRRIEAFDDVVSIDAGKRFGCAIRPGGAVWCWGENDAAQIGTHETIPCGDCTPIPECADSECVPTPQLMEGLEQGVEELALGDSHGCARRVDGTVVCWGDNAYGQVAHPDVGATVASPHLVDGVTDARQLTSGRHHTCALIGSPGVVTCWGRNDRAQVGNGGTDDAVAVPTTVSDLSDAVEVVGGGSHTCARREGGAVVCWGYNYLGALGNGSTRPTRAGTIQEVVGLDDAVALAAGQYFTCALRASDTVVCWGDNRHGQLGDGTAEGEGCADRPCRTTPSNTLVVSDAVLVNGGHLHACAANGGGTLWCWGYNLGGQLGTGGVDDGPTPTPVEVMGLPDP